MFQIEQITTDAKQQQTLQLPDGTLITFAMTYRESQSGWFADITYTPSNFTLLGMRVCALPNLLRQWKNLLPFGLLCSTAGPREPTQQEDFSSGFASLFILDSDEVLQYEQFLQGK